MQDALRIDDPDDPRIAMFLNVRDRDLAGRGAGFIAEGEVVIRQLLQSRDFSARALLVAADRLATKSELLGGVPENVPVYAAAQEVMDRIVGFHIHRGLLAFGERVAEFRPEDLLVARPRLVLGLVGIGNHDNLGGIFRNAAAFGVEAMLLDDTCCDPLYRKALRVSVGAVLKVRHARAGSGADLVTRLVEAGYAPVGLSPQGRDDIGDIGTIDRPALVLGAEGPGLPPALLAQTRSVRIDMSGGFDSLNVATTSGIALHELRRALGAGAFNP
ncbi:TrmH family RNA methyltransferase [Methylobrevis pamukkalensis]|uniref:23S rRNA (Guanosine-2'-O-)-methyltransferase RlmB n=1 Tax=Methylobrevis pamukkalensis TaxID=1439726 RepID=A0A1E3GZ20_9HYPH|nr:RNA methyltransferase [Methylobrevis pamukkalensis]ODN69317.1 23S rRNA (guanosine-2'-O-)-methyltransferase RlmB [Methylobrevis pamukkalensis]